MNITIVVSTPYMDEASLCDRVALMQEGKIMEINSPKGITENFKKPLWAMRSSDMYRLMLDLRGLSEVETCYPFGQYHHVVFKQNINSVEEVKQLITGISEKEIEIKRIQATIEDSFMELMRQ